MKDELDPCGATAVFVACDSPAVLRDTLLARLELPYPVLVDIERSTYSDWGLGRASAAVVWGDPRAWFRSAAAIVGGERPMRPGADPLQLGGDFVVDAAGKVVYARPQRRDDRPPVAKLVEVVARTAGVLEGNR